LAGDVGDDEVAARRAAISAWSMASRASTRLRNLRPRLRSMRRMRRTSSWSSAVREPFAGRLRQREACRFAGLF
jgi:hypothetical protein